MTLGAPKAFALIGGKKDENNQLGPISLKLLQEKWSENARKSGIKFPLEEFGDCTMRALKQSQSVAGAVLSSTKLCDSRSVECRNEKISGLLNNSLNAPKNIPKPLDLAIPRVKKIFGKDAYVRTAINEDGCAEKTPMGLKNNTDVDAFMANIAAKAVTIVYECLVKGFDSFYDENTVKIASLLAFLAGKALENRKESSNYRKLYIMSLQLLGMVLDDETNVKIQELLKDPTKITESDCLKFNHKWLSSDISKPLDFAIPPVKKIFIIIIINIIIINIIVINNNINNNNNIIIINNN